MSSSGSSAKTPVKGSQQLYEGPGASAGVETRAGFFEADDTTREDGLTLGTGRESRCLQGDWKFGRLWSLQTGRRRRFCVGDVNIFSKTDEQGFYGDGSMSGDLDVGCIQSFYDDGNSKAIRPPGTISEACSSSEIASIAASTSRALGEALSSKVGALSPAARVRETGASSFRPTSSSTSPQIGEASSC